MKLTLSRHSFRAEPPAESFRVSPQVERVRWVKVAPGGDFVDRPPFCGTKPVGSELAPSPNELIWQSLFTKRVIRRYSRIHRKKRN